MAVLSGCKNPKSSEDRSLLDTLVDIKDGKRLRYIILKS